jgi:starch synthase
VLTNPQLARSFGRAGRERVAARFTWDRIADVLAAYYEELLAARTTGRAA